MLPRRSKTEDASVVSKRSSASPSFPGPRDALPRRSMSDSMAGSVQEADEEQPIESPLSHSPPTMIMSIEPGIYTITNEDSGMIVTSGGVGGKLGVFGPYYREGYNLWEFRPLGKGWTIKNVFGESYYLTTEPSSYGRFVSVVVHNFPITWDVQIEHEDPGLFSISWPNSDSTWHLKDDEDGPMIVLDTNTPEDAPGRGLWRITYKKALPSDPSGHGSDCSWMSGSGIDDLEWSDDPDSDTEGSYTVVKTTTKTKKITKQAWKEGVRKYGLETPF